VRIGSRSSPLAIAQASGIAQALRGLHPGVEFEIVRIETTGDARRDAPFAAVGAKGMFVKEIEQALLDGHVDLGVHSMKDMPAELPEGLEIGCVPAREDARDALVGPAGSAGGPGGPGPAVTLAALARGARVGTASVRRRAQLLAYRPDLLVSDVRGNVETRLRRLDEGRFDAIVLACAGLARLGLQDRICERIAPAICVPAVGQGALALEARSGDARTLDLITALNDPDTADAVAAERAFLKRLSGGCSVPAGAYAAIDGDALRIVAVIAAPNGEERMFDSCAAPRSQALDAGAELARRMLDAGGAALLGRPSPDGG